MCRRLITLQIVAWIALLLPIHFSVAMETGSVSQPAQNSSQATTQEKNHAAFRWLQLGVDVRGRAEANTGLNFVPAKNDTYYLHRLRLNASIEATPWLRFFAQGQDSRAPGYSRTPVPASSANPMDFRQGYMELGTKGKNPWTFRLGRQELFFGNGRLVGNSNWGNAGRAFDAIRLIYQKPGIKLDGFTSSVVVPVNGSFDRPHFNNKFHGFYSSFNHLPPRSLLEVVEAYFLLKTNSRARGELGSNGNLRIYTYGISANGKAPGRFDYRLELAVQAGHISADPVRSWGGHWQFAYTPPCFKKATRLAVEYNYASGDRNPLDGHRGTFDQLYPSSHDKLGTLDRIGWRNIQNFSTKLEWKPAANWTGNLEFHEFWLATRKDSLYAKDGAAVMRNTKATSSRVGSEFDSYATYSWTKRIELGFGYAHMWAGPYLGQTTGSKGASYPYVMWRFHS